MSPILYQVGQVIDVQIVVVECCTVHIRVPPYLGDAQTSELPALQKAPKRRPNPVARRLTPVFAREMEDTALTYVSDIFSACAYAWTSATA